MQLFYCPEIEENSDSFYLNQEDAKHALVVLRRKVGELIDITDGKGWHFKGKILNDNPKKCQIEITEKQYFNSKKSYYIHIAVAPTKNLDRIEYFVEKAVEMGIDEISFIFTKHSERKNLNLERIEKIAISAMKQSLKFRLPVLNEAKNFKQFISQKFEGQLFIAHETINPMHHLLKMALPNASYTVLIGTEGGFTEDEVQEANHQGFTPVSLGESRLRTETAALATCFALNFLQIIKI
jgi:16S rRNA (uracil1498-N3)-methyltransferase